MQPTNDAFVREWTVLQTQHEQYEFIALGIKLVAVSLFAVGQALGWPPQLVGLLMLVLWIQDAIFKTYQARLGDRLMQLEHQLALASEATTRPCQLHSGWLATRGSLGGLMREYLRSALRPTVAFPYGLLLAALLLLPV